MSSRAIINTGVVRNDGTGDNLYQTGTKVNSNFAALWLFLGGDSNVISNEIRIEADALVFEGVSANTFETSLMAVDPTADNIVTIPDSSGELILTTTAQTLLKKTLIEPIMSLPQLVSGSANFIVTPNGSIDSDTNIRIPALADSDTFVFLGVAQTLVNKTLQSAVLVDANISGSLNDVNGAGMIQFTATASAVNGINITNGATGNGPSITSTGTNTNVDLKIGTKGIGALIVESKLALKSLTNASSGAISLSVPLSIMNSGTAISMTLAEGTAVGEMKKVLNKGAGIATITPVNFANGTSLGLKQYGLAEFIWEGTNWFLHGDSDQYKSIT